MADALRQQFLEALVGTRQRDIKDLDGLPLDERVLVLDLIETHAHATLDVLWPEIIKLLAKILEYEHALEHVADRKTHIDYGMTFCEDCIKLAQSALDGVNRADFEEIARG